MISLRVSATKLVNKNEPEEIPKEFPSRRVLAMNYIPCCAFVISPLTLGILLNHIKINSIQVPFQVLLSK